MDADVCAYLLDDSQAGETLRRLDDRSLFVIDQGQGHCRYHHLFQEFLLRQAEVRLDDLAPLHRRVATFYNRQREVEAAVPHLLAAGDFVDVADLLSSVARDMIHRGRYVRLANWVDQLPAAMLDDYPTLLMHRGDAARLLSEFDEALTWYRRAQGHAEEQDQPLAQVRAIRGQALVYLDTVQPALAAPLLQEALDLVRGVDPQERVHLLFLMAENLANQARLGQAQRLYRTMQRHCPTFDYPDIEPRIRVRAGRLAEARELGEEILSTASWGTEQPRMPRSHREATVLLAWICAMTGDGDGARRYADHGLQLGQDLQSPIVECVSLARRGHGWLAGSDYNPHRANESYRQSLTIAEDIGVPRFGAEAHLGLTVIEGLSGHAARAREHANAARDILAQAGGMVHIGQELG